MPMMEYQEFLHKLQKRGSKAHHIGHCLGTRDAFRWVRKNKWKLLGGQTCDMYLYSKIINSVNLQLIDSLFEGHTVIFPHQMGSLLLVSTEGGVAMEGDEVKTNYKTDWKKTLQYWYEDEEARNSHKTVKCVQNRLYYIHYCKCGARYGNRGFYRFRPNRSLLKKLGKVLAERQVNTEILERP